MTVDPFTSASPTYIAAQRTNQAKGYGWCFAPELDHLEPCYVRALKSIVSAFGHTGRQTVSTSTTRTETKLTTGLKT